MSIYAQFICEETGKLEEVSFDTCPYRGHHGALIEITDSWEWTETVDQDDGAPPA